MSNAIKESVHQWLKSLECPICLEGLDDPVSTSCHHLFCRKCITTFIKTNNVKNRSSCPLCKTAVSKRGLNERPMLKEILSLTKEVSTGIKLDSGIDVSPPKRFCQKENNEPSKALMETFHLLHPSPAKPSNFSVNYSKRKLNDDQHPTVLNKRVKNSKGTSFSGSIYDDSSTSHEPNGFRISNTNINSGFPIGEKKMEECPKGGESSTPKLDLRVRETHCLIGKENKTTSSPPAFRLDFLTPQSLNKPAIKTKSSAIHNKPLVYTPSNTSDAFDNIIQKDDATHLRLSTIKTYTRKKQAGLDQTAMDVNEKVSQWLQNTPSKFVLDSSSAASSPDILIVHENLASDRSGLEKDQIEDSKATMKKIFKTKDMSYKMTNLTRNGLSSSQDPYKFISSQKTPVKPKRRGRGRKARGKSFKLPIVVKKAAKEITPTKIFRGDLHQPCTSKMGMDIIVDLPEDVFVTKKMRNPKGTPDTMVDVNMPPPLIAKEREMDNEDDIENDIDLFVTPAINLTDYCNKNGTFEQGEDENDSKGARRKSAPKSGSKNSKACRKKSPKFQRDPELPSTQEQIDRLNAKISEAEKFELSIEKSTDTSHRGGPVEKGEESTFIATIAHPDVSIACDKLSSPKPVKSSKEMIFPVKTTPRKPLGQANRFNEEVSDSSKKFASVIQNFNETYSGVLSTPDRDKCFKTVVQIQKLTKGIFPLANSVSNHESSPIEKTRSGDVTDSSDTDIVVFDDIPKNNKNEPPPLLSRNVWVEEQMPLSPVVIIDDLSFTANRVNEKSVESNAIRSSSGFPGYDENLDNEKSSSQDAQLKVDLNNCQNSNSNHFPREIVTTSNENPEHLANISDVILSTLSKLVRQAEKMNSNEDVMERVTDNNEVSKGETEVLKEPSCNLSLEVSEVIPTSYEATKISDCTKNYESKPLPVKSTSLELDPTLTDVEELTSESSLNESRPLRLEESNVTENSVNSDDMVRVMISVPSKTFKNPSESHKAAATLMSQKCPGCNCTFNLGFEVRVKVENKSGGDGEVHSGLLSVLNVPTVLKAVSLQTNLQSSSKTVGTLTLQELKVNSSVQTENTDAVDISSKKTYDDVKTQTYCQELTSNLESNDFKTKIPEDKPSNSSSHSGATDSSSRERSAKSSGFTGKDEQTKNKLNEMVNGLSQTSSFTMQSIPDSANRQLNDMEVTPSLEKEMSKIPDSILITRPWLASFFTQEEGFEDSEEQLFAENVPQEKPSTEFDKNCTDEENIPVSKPEKFQNIMNNTSVSFAKESATTEDNELDNFMQNEDSLPEMNEENLSKNKMPDTKLEDDFLLKEESIPPFDKDGNLEEVLDIIPETVGILDDDHNDILGLTALEEEMNFSSSERDDNMENDAQSVQTSPQLIPSSPDSPKVQILRKTSKLSRKKRIDQSLSTASTSSVAANPSDPFHPSLESVPHINEEKKTRRYNISDSDSGNSESSSVEKLSLKIKPIPREVKSPEFLPVSDNRLARLYISLDHDDPGMKKVESQVAPLTSKLMKNHASARTNSTQRRKLFSFNPENILNVSSGIEGTNHIKYQIPSSTVSSPSLEVKQKRKKKFQRISSSSDSDSELERFFKSKAASKTKGESLKSQQSEITDRKELPELEIYTDLEDLTPRTAHKRIQENIMKDLNFIPLIKISTDEEMSEINVAPQNENLESCDRSTDTCSDLKKYEDPNKIQQDICAIKAQLSKLEKKKLELDMKKNKIDTIEKERVCDKTPEKAQFTLQTEMKTPTKNDDDSDESDLFESPIPPTPPTKKSTSSNYSRFRMV